MTPIRIDSNSTNHPAFAGVFGIDCGKIASGQRATNSPAALTTTTFAKDKRTMAETHPSNAARTHETWKSIEGFPGYEVSDHGNVRSWWKRNGRKRAIIGDSAHILGVGDGYYPKVVLTRDGRKFDKNIHALVLEAFIGPRPSPHHYGLHGPAGSRVAHVDNLSWGTQAQNCGPDKVRDGTAQVGERHGCAKFTEADIIEIRRLYQAGFKQTEIAARYGVRQGHISDICLGKVWKCVPMAGAAA